MSNKKLVWVLCLIVSLVLLSTACKKKAAQATPPPAPPAVVTPEPEVKPAPDTEVREGFVTPEPEQAPIDTAAEINARGELKTVYFEFDKSDLTETARATLRGNADWLKANSKWNVVIEGHCDERGTIEYNLALGQRRANAARDYLTSLGVTSGRLRVVSYGEERPVDPGHNEAAWVKNRRAESKVEEP
jgi:peptidoglycan-associated lipoprotein